METIPLSNLVDLDFEASSTKSRTITITATDPGGLVFQKLDILLTDVNEPPTGISLSHSVVRENAAVGTVVGTLSVTNPEFGGWSDGELLLDLNVIWPLLTLGQRLKVAGGLDHEMTEKRTISVRQQTVELFTL